MIKKEIVVIRLSSRAYRDLRITTHCALVARAFGAQKIFLPMEASPRIKETVNKITQKFGGNFNVDYYHNSLALLSQLKKEGFTLIHLTMYGETPTKKMKKIQEHSRIGIIIGADKVPKIVYALADYNISITHQPHSEVAALSVFLHYFLGGKEEQLIFAHPKIKIIPTPKGKNVKRISE